MKKTTKSALKEVAMPYHEPKRVTIEKAANGFIINKGYGEKACIAKTMKEAQTLQAKFLR